MITRLDICDAYHVFAMLHHKGQYSREYAIFGRLHRIGYTPGMSVQKGKLESEGARAAYRNLCIANGV